MIGIVMEKTDDRQPFEQKTHSQSIKNSAVVGLQAGCLTFLVAGVAIVVGLLLDTRLDTFPRWTLILLAGSAPFALGGVYWLVRRALRRLRGMGETRDDHEKIE